MNEVLIAEDAEVDYAESLRWYADRSRRAAEGFETEFSRALAAISKEPGRFPLCDDRHRYYLLNRYPFQVIYRKITEGRWLVVAVAHAKRRPGYWSNR